MPTQLGQIQLAAGEDAIETLSIYGTDGSTTIDITGWSLEFVATLPGGATVITLTSPATITVASPLAYQALLNFASADTVDLPPGYYDFTIRRTDAGAVAEVTDGTLMLIP